MNLNNHDHDHRETYPSRPVYLVQSKWVSDGDKGNWKGVLSYECKACAKEHAEAIIQHSSGLLTARVVGFGA